MGDVGGVGERVIRAAALPRAGEGGARIAMVAPASYGPETSRDLAAVEELRRLGHRVELAPHWRSRHGYLAGTDEERAADLNELFRRDDVDLILCLRGGWGSARLLDRLDYAALAAHPKLISGFSDITSLHLAVWRETGLVTLYGPTLRRLGVPEETFTTRWFWRLARGEAGEGAVLPRPEEEGWTPQGGALRTLVPGRAEGRLVGGCLSLVVASLGTPWEIETEGRILFLEDVDEEPYRVDRMLTQLRLAGKLEAAAGLVIGELVGGTPPAAFPYGSLSFDDVLEEIVVPLGVPAVYGLPVGHGRHLAALPHGARAELDADRCELRLLEPAVEVAGGTGAR